MDPINMIKTFIGKGLTPQEMINTMNVQNPIIGNLVNMAKNGNTEGIENFARNMFKERGRDFDKEFTEFRNNFK